MISIPNSDIKRYNIDISKCDMACQPCNWDVKDIIDFWKIEGVPSHLWKGLFIKWANLKIRNYTEGTYKNFYKNYEEATNGVYSFLMAKGIIDLFDLRHAYVIGLNAHNREK